MRHKTIYLIFIIYLLDVILLAGCMTIRTMEVEDYSNQGNIHIVALENKTWYQVYSVRQVKSVLGDDHLVLQNNKGDSIACIHLDDVDYLEVYRFSAEKAGYSFFVGLTFFIILLFSGI